MANNPNPSSPLPDVFSPATRDWFLRAFKQPTAVQSRTTAALYANEVNDLPVRQTPMFTRLREAGFSSSPQGLDWG